jgi:hypothetical protein
MASTAYYQWVDAGKPYKQSKPTEHAWNVVRGHGYTVYHYPNDDHLKAVPPEDHTPFSATGWPITSKRWVSHAIDIMPGGGPVALPALARQIIADKDAEVPGTKWIKYINWTDENGNCWQTSWRPNKQTVKSTDKGHIHLSGRSDMDTSMEVTDSGWDPVERAMDMAMTPAEFLTLLKDPNITAYFRAIAWQYAGGGLPPNVSSTLTALTQTHVATAGAQLSDKLVALQTSLDVANTKLDQLAAGGVPPAELDELKEQLTAIKENTERLVTATKAAGLAVS